MKEKEYKYMVDVVCMTFNQSKYILDALNGFVMQQTNFPFVVMVVDDASTDGEQKIIKEFISKQFDLNDTKVAYEEKTDYAHITFARHKMNLNCHIAALYLKENHHSLRKKKLPYLTLWRNSAKYEALCEGDDYWIDPLKLQKQVDFMENNPEYSMCFTNVQVVCENGVKRQNNLYKHLIEKDYSGFEILERWTIPTASVMHLNNYECCPSDSRFIYGDIILFLHMERIGKIHCLNEKMVVYRRNPGGITAKKNNYKRIIEHYHAILEHFGYKYTDVINRLIAKAYIHGFISFKLNKESWIILNKVIHSSDTCRYFLLYFPKIFFNIIKNKFSL